MIKFFIFTLILGLPLAKATIFSVDSETTYVDGTKIINYQNQVFQIKNDKDGVICYGIRATGTPTLSCVKIQSTPSAH
jgi:hypothetical protein